MARLCISADSHVVEPPEMFAPLEKRLGSRAPRMVHNEGVGDQLDLGNGKLGMPIGGFLIAGMDVGSPETKAQARRGYAIARPGVYDLHERMNDQDRDGVSAEVLYPSILFNVYQVDETEVVQATFEAYNDWLSDYIAKAPRNRLFGLGAIQLRDLDSAINELKRVQEMGFVGLCIPCTAPPELPFSDEYYEPFWAAAERAGLPLTMHIFSSSTPNHGLPNWPGANYPLAYVGMEVTVATLIASGVCERHPDLKFVPTEFETGWVGNFLRRVDHAWYRAGGTLTPNVKLPRQPSDYWHRNFMVTFEDDPIGIRTRDFIGVENLMWGSDYPHGDSIFPESQRVLDGLFGEELESERQAITAGNAIALYKLPFDVEGTAVRTAVGTATVR